MLAFQVQADGAGFFSLVEEPVLTSFKSQRIGLNVPFFSFRKTGDDCRIDSTTEKNAERNVADELSFDRRCKSFLNSKFQLLIGNRFDALAAGNLPVALERHRMIFQPQSEAMARRKLLNTVECGLRPRH